MTMESPPTASSSGALDTLRARGFVQQITDEAALAARLAAGPVTFYAGFDPTAASLHVGQYIPLMAMAHLARAGHRAIAVLRSVEPPRRKISECIAMLPTDSTATIDGDFAGDVEEAIAAHGDPLEPPAWD